MASAQRVSELLALSVREAYIRWNSNNWGGIQVKRTVFAPDSKGPLHECLHFLGNVWGVRFVLQPPGLHRAPLTDFTGLMLLLPRQYCQLFFRNPHAVPGRWALDDRQSSLSLGILAIRFCRTNFHDDVGLYRRGCTSSELTRDFVPRHSCWLPH